MPVKVQVLESLLKQASYDSTEVNFLVEGFTEGFSIGYEGSMEVKITAPNLPFHIGDKVVLWNKVMKEVKAGRYAGPFGKIPFRNFIQSPIGLVEKDGDKDTHLIFHLSYPRIKQSTSINANTPTELSTVTYPDFDQAIQLCLLVGRSCHISRSDVKMAFRNLCIRKQHWCLLVMKARSPFDGKFYYFFDKNLPFGASISCSHFQCFSRAISYLVTYRTGKKNVRYLDDFLFMALLKAVCNNQVQVFMDICDMINLPVNLEKTYWVTNMLVFLGLLIDTVCQLVLIPTEKISRAKSMINQVLKKKSSKLTINQLQKICSFLNFLGRCVVPG